MRKGNYKTMEYKGFTFLRTWNTIWASELQDNGKWRGLGRGGYEYIVFGNGNMITFYSLLEVKTYINAHIALTEANKAMENILKGAVLA